MSRKKIENIEKKNIRKRKYYKKKKKLAKNIRDIELSRKE